MSAIDSGGKDISLPPNEDPLKNKELKSRKLRNFVTEITDINRNPTDSSVLAILSDRPTNPELLVHQGELLYRARIYTGDKASAHSGFYGYSPSDSFVPPREKATDMRANYRNIPYLYCSNNPYISLCEARPRLGASVSIATIIVEQPLTLFDMTIKQKPPQIDSTKVNLLSDLSKLFSYPVTNEDDTLHYIPTQFIAEYIKKLNYDGIVYKSAFAEQTDDTPADNIVVFNFNKFRPIRSNIYHIPHLNYTPERIDNDSRAIQALSPDTLRLHSNEG